MKKFLKLLSNLFRSRQKTVTYPPTNEYIFVDGEPIQTTYDY